MDDADNVPPVFRSLVDRLGPPVPVEDARSRWAELVAAAEAGTATLITRDGREWVALVPMAEVAEPVAWMPMWPLSEARAKLGDVIHESHARTQVLTRHRKPVAAVIDATVLLDRPTPADRLPAETLLDAGRRIVLEGDPGAPGRMDFDGEVTEQSEPACYTATAVNRDGTTVAVGVGPSLGEALLRLAAPTEGTPVIWSVMRGESPNAAAVEPQMIGVDIPLQVLAWAEAHGMTEDDPDVYLLIAPADGARPFDGELATRMDVLPPETVAQIEEAITNA